jgi:hypothetical protein
MDVWHAGIAFDAVTVMHNKMLVTLAISPGAGVPPLLMDIVSRFKDTVAGQTKAWRNVESVRPDSRAPRGAVV